MSERTFTLFFGGGEVPGWRSLLLEEQVHGISLTYWNLKRRMPKRKPWSLAEHVPEGTQLLLESGAYTANKDPGQMDVDGWKAYDAEYRDFVTANIDRIDLVTEFDGHILGLEYIEQQRYEFWSHIPAEKFMPVWHESYGMDELERLATTYDHVAIPAEALTSSQRIPAKINSLTQRFGTKFHGAAITKTDALTNVRFASAASTSWLSPIQFGDTIVWDGTRLRRYPKKYKEQARHRHRTLFTRAGYDAEKIADGDPNEVARFTVWSWLQLEEHVGKRRHTRPFDVIEGDGDDSSRATDDDEPVTGWGDDDDPDSAQHLAGSVARHPSQTRKPLVPRQERRLLPVFGLEEVEVDTGEVDEDETPVTRTEVVMRAQRKSLRRCDTCFVSGTCPAYEPENECAFDLPLELRDRSQLLTLLKGVIEMQAQRVAFARFAEELEGGYPDPNLSTEIERLFKITGLLKEIEDTRDTFDLTVRAKAGAGVLSRIFGGGQEQSPGPPALEQGGLDRMETDRLIVGIVDAEVVEESSYRTDGPQR